MNAASYIPQHLLEPFGLTQDPLTSAEIVALSEQFKQWLKDAFSEYDITELVSARAYYVDQLLSKLWCQHQLDEDQISLIAVGGYGRGELHPYSDVDLLILTQNKIDKALEEKYRCLSPNFGM